MSTAQLRIAIDAEKVATFCQDRGIHTLWVFGSALRDDFDPAQSDLDVFAEFDPGALNGVGLRYFDFADELSQIAGCRVDFCSELHPLIRDRVLPHAAKVYERS